VIDLTASLGLRRWVLASAVFASAASLLAHER
jgi:hypothetical protein